MRRLRLPILTLVLLAAVPSGASAASRVPGEVVVRYAGSERAVTERVGDVDRALQRLRARSDVRYAVANLKAKASAFLPDDTGRGQGWQAIQWNMAGPFGVNAPDAWSNLIAAGRPGASGVVVAVLDTGVAYRDAGKLKRSPDLDPARFRRGYDFVSGDPFPIDRNGHGTHVASTIAETTNNGFGLTGLAYGATLMPVRVLDDQGEGDASDIADGVRFAARNGADVINLSLEFTSDVTAREIPQLLDAIDYAHRKGAFIVAASGNEAVRTVALPARAGHVVSVGATTERGCLSDFSNQGSGLDLVAPGGGADAFVEDALCRPDDPSGRNISQVTLIGKERRRFGIPDTYQGTSMAVPHVAAAAALVIASGVKGPNPGPVTIERHLEATSRDLGPAGPDTRYGAGLLDAAAATRAAPAR